MKDLVAIAEKIAVKLIERRQTIAIAESSTGGLISAALLAVPTMIAGIYGMNFKHMPELDLEWGYPLAILLMVAIDFFLYTRFKKSKWM